MQFNGSHSFFLLAPPQTSIHGAYKESKEDEIARTVYIGNIGPNMAPSKIVEFFSICGPVAFVRMAGEEHQASRFAFIEFLDLSGAQSAMGLTGQMLMDRQIKYVAIVISNISIRVNRSKNAIVKPPVKLTNEEQRHLQHTIRHLSNKIAAARGLDNDDQGRRRKRHRSEEEDEYESRRKRMYIVGCC